jgi:D-threo-aldose 1-dehydrogenase
MDPAGRKRIGRTGLEVSRLGFGAAALGNLYAPVSDAAAAEAVAAACSAGIALFDTAPFYGYGLSEERLGRALCERPRASYVLSTKVGRLLVPRPAGSERDDGFVAAHPFDPVYDYSYDGVMRSVEESLRRLGCGRIDVALIHDVGALTHGAAEHAAVFETALGGGYRALDELRRAGDIAAVGLGVNEWEVCLEAMERGSFDCFLLAGRYTLLEQGALARLLPACEERGISVIVGGPYNSGILASEPGPDSRYDYAPASAEVLERARRIAAICRSHDVSLQAAALQFPLLHPAVASVIPGARSKAEVEANAAFVRHRLPPALWEDLKRAGLLAPDAPTRDDS